MAFGVEVINRFVVAATQGTASVRAREMPDPMLGGQAVVDKLEDVRSEKGREWCRDGADVKADPIGKGLRVHAIPSTGSADLVDQGLEGRVISGADCIEEFRLGLQGGWVRVTEVVVVACGDLTVHGHVA